MSADKLPARLSKPAIHGLLTALITLASACSTAPRSTAGRADVPSIVHIALVPAAPEFAPAAAEYDSLWRAEGRRVIAAMESVTGLRFVSDDYADTLIVANVLEAPSNSGYRETPMRLRASYPTDVKLATLIHELGHRLQAEVTARSEEPHDALFLWLYDVWAGLYGPDWADRQVEVEKKRSARYVAAWEGALRLSRAERAARWRQLVRER